MPFQWTMPRRHRRAGGVKGVVVRRIGAETPAARGRGPGERRGKSPLDRRRRERRGHGGGRDRAANFRMTAARRSSRGRGRRGQRSAPGRTRAWRDHATLESSPWREPSAGRTSSTRRSARAMVRLCPQLEQRPRRFHENGRSFSWRRSGHRRRRNPQCRSPQRVKTARQSYTPGCGGPRVERKCSSWTRRSSSSSRRPRADAPGSGPALKGHHPSGGAGLLHELPESPLRVTDRDAPAVLRRQERPLGPVADGVLHVDHPQRGFFASNGQLNAAGPRWPLAVIEKRDVLCRHVSVAN